MAPVEILPLQETLVLRARGSELLILPHHVKELKQRTVPREFSSYFVAEALINRPARKLFEAWLRKDHSLWARLYKVIQEMEIEKEQAADADETASSAQLEPKEAQEESATEEGKMAIKKVAKASAKSAAPKKESKAETKKAATKKKATAAPEKKKKTVTKKTATVKKGSTANQKTSKKG